MRILALASSKYKPRAGHFHEKAHARRLTSPLLLADLEDDLALHRQVTIHGGGHLIDALALLGAQLGAVLIVAKLLELGAGLPHRLHGLGGGRGLVWVGWLWADERADLLGLDKGVEASEEVGQHGGHLGVYGAIVAVRGDGAAQLAHMRRPLCLPRLLGLMILKLG